MWKSWSYMFSSPPCFLLSSLRWRSHWCRLICVALSESGWKPGLLWSEPPPETNTWQTDTAPLSSSTRWANKSCSHDPPLETNSQKLTLRYTGPHPMAWIINPSVVRLKLPAALKVHPTFHVSLLKSVVECPLSPPTEPSPQIIDDHPVYMVSWMSAGGAGGSSTWLTGKCSWVSKCHSSWTLNC